MPLSAGDKLGPYEILAPIGAGGMGEVYRARDTKLNRDVAIKVLPESFALDADRVARQIANSPLVKTAFFGCDPNFGRILMAAGRDAADVAMTTNFGSAILKKFVVITDEIPAPKLPQARRSKRVPVKTRGKNQAIRQAR